MLHNYSSPISPNELPIWIKNPMFCLFWAFQNVLLKMHSTEKPSQPLILYLPALPLSPPPLPLSIWYHQLWQAADSDGELVNTDRDTGSSVRVSLGVQPRSMSVGSVRLSPSERVDPGDWVIERLVFEPADSPNKLIPTPTITNTPIPSLTPDLQRRERQI